jgi:pyruvate,water dikinase
MFLALSLTMAARNLHTPVKMVEELSRRPLSESAGKKGMSYTIDYSKISMKLTASVGGKNASLGEMLNHLTARGVAIPDGFAVTASAYWRFLDHNDLKNKMSRALKRLDLNAFSNLDEVALELRNLIAGGSWPDEVRDDIVTAYESLLKRSPREISVAVRSSATAEDLPGASFAGQMETYLNVRGEKALLEACHRCFASLFTARAIKYRVDNGFEHMTVAVSVGVQRMVRSDLGCAGVGFTVEPETGNPNVVVLTGAYGLGENVVQGAVTPDQFTVFKQGMRIGLPSILTRVTGA